jgi:HAMP domain-containing protein
VRRLAWTALTVGAVAVVLGVVLGRKLAQPLRALTGSAIKLGQGDFSTSIPVGGTAETATLGHTMEDMRSNLVDLTAALRRREAEAQALLKGIVEGVVAVDRRAHDPLPESAGGAAARHRPAGRNRPVLRRRAEAGSRRRRASPASSTARSSRLAVRDRRVQPRSCTAPTARRAPW